MLLNANESTNMQYYVRLASGQEIGPYSSYHLAQISASTMPVVEGVAPQIVPRTSAGASVLLG